ncbi:hypothetical protein H8356DRAFT_1287191 [Neocallimastix lanati (nom. inval.)]|nr:hypothetical protein H8356DRAFT_1287191 [Neocallimastix sp. JGI-2020a]
MSKSEKLYLNFPYKIEELHWNENHTRNKENIYCYCGKNIKENESFIKCQKCGQLFHSKCIKTLKQPHLFGDVYYYFKCSVCNKGKEIYKRNDISWITCLYLVIYNIVKSRKDNNINKNIEKNYYCRFKEDICNYIDNNWEYFFPNKFRPLEWVNIINNTLLSNPTIFISETKNCWTLKSFDIIEFEKKQDKNNLFDYKTLNDLNDNISSKTSEDQLSNATFTISSSELTSLSEIDQYLSNSSDDIYKFNTKNGVKNDLKLNENQKNDKNNKNKSKKEYERKKENKNLPGLYKEDKNTIENTSLPGLNKADCVKVEIENLPMLNKNNIEVENKGDSILTEKYEILIKDKEKLKQNENRLDNEKIFKEYKNIIEKNEKIKIIKRNNNKLENKMENKLIKIDSNKIDNYKITSEEKNELFEKDNNKEENIREPGINKNCIKLENKNENSELIKNSNNKMETDIKRLNKEQNNNSKVKTDKMVI